MDRSDWIASITSLNGSMNGSPSPYALGLCEKNLKYYLWGADEG